MKARGKYSFSLAQDGLGWSASCPSHFTTRESTAVPAEQEGGWDPETGLDCFGEEKILLLFGI